MALRLVQPVDGPAASQITPPPPSLRAGALSIGEDAIRRLVAGDVGGWRDLAAGTAEIEDIHARYLSRRVLLESTLAQPKAPIAALAQGFYAGAQAGVAFLEEEPREPILLNLTGVLFYELGAIVAAEALFRAAQRLDAEVPGVEGNLRECARRRRSGSMLTRAIPAPVLRGLRDLVPRAQEVARRAVPATGLTLSLCMIVKDEEAMLPRCLAAVADHVDEIVIVATGSTDGTVAIAESFGARVLHHEWTGDFSEARNIGLDAARGEWLMFLDADEVLVSEDGPALRTALGQTWREAFYINETNHMGHEEDGSAIDHQAMRVWRNRPSYRFEGRVHEHFSESLPAIVERIGMLPVRVDHYGYLTAVRSAKDKTQRNLELLQRQAAEGNDSPFLHFNLGTEYSVAGDQALALQHMERAWQQLADEPGHGSGRGYFPTLANRYIRLLLTNGRVQDGLRVADEVLALLPAFTDVVYSQAFAHRHLGDRAAAIAAARRCLEMGDAPAAYVATLGAGTFLARIMLAELLVAEGRADEAEEHLHRVVVDHPGYIGGVEPYAKALLRRGVPAAEVAERLHELVADMTPGQRFLLAVPFYEAGAVVEAEAELRAILAAQPGAHAARLALAESLLSQNRLDEAAQTALEVPADAPHARTASSTVLFARLAGGADPDAVEAAFAYAREAGLDAGQLALLGAWRDGTVAADAIPAGAAPVAAVMLEALARLEDFDGFERLAIAVEGLALPWRERRELLAGVYLRRGFVDSAAAEWISAVQTEGPDARALLGLAQVAAARGLAEDAEVLREEARALEAARP